MQPVEPEEACCEAIPKSALAALLCGAAHRRCDRRTGRRADDRLERSAFSRAGGRSDRGSRRSGETLSWNLRGKTVEIAGYVLPSDREGDLVYQFLLIPWTGLCSPCRAAAAQPGRADHAEEPVTSSAETYETVSVTGVLEPELEKTQLFMLDGVSVIEIRLPHRRRADRAGRQGDRRDGAAERESLGLPQASEPLGQSRATDGAATPPRPGPPTRSSRICASLGTEENRAGMARYGIKTDDGARRLQRAC